MGRLLLAAALAASSGCYKPSVLDCQYACTADMECPDGTTCFAGRCTSQMMSCQPDAPMPIDGDVDPDGGSACDPLHAWCAEESGTSMLLLGVWGTDRTNVWAVGDGGTIVRRDGNGKWLPQTSMTNERLHAVHGLDTNNVFAVGASGQYVEWNGSVWTPVTYGNKAFNAVFASSSTTVWLVGDTGTSYYVKPFSGTSSPLGGIAIGINAVTACASPAGPGVCAAGNAKNTWYRNVTTTTGNWITGPGLGASFAFNDLVADTTTPSFAFYAVSASGVDHFVMGAWSTDFTSMAGAYTAIAGDGLDLWIAGKKGVAQRSMDSNWTEDATSPTNLEDIVVFRNDIFVVGANGGIFHRSRP